MSDKSVPRRGPKGARTPAEDPGAAAERAVRIDALMDLPIKQQPQITVFGDDDVVGINPAPAGKTPDA
jgi:hypothetical protein